jgi:hypothetical protein
MMLEPTPKDFDHVYGECRKSPDTVLGRLWCDAHDSRWRSGPTCDARLDFEDAVERLLERLEQR